MLFPGTYFAVVQQHFYTFLDIFQYVFFFHIDMIVSNRGLCNRVKFQSIISSL